MKLYYRKEIYSADDSVAIQTYIKDEEHGYLEPYGMATLCLAGYNIKLADDEICLPAYKMSPEFIDTVIEDIVDEIVTGIRIGFGKGFIAKLKTNWEDNVEMV